MVRSGAGGGGIYFSYIQISWPEMALRNCSFLHWGKFAGIHFIAFIYTTTVKPAAFSFASRYCMSGRHVYSIVGGEINIDFPFVVWL